MKLKTARQWNRVTVGMVMLSLLIWPFAVGTRGVEAAGATPAQQQSNTVYSGRATVVNATALGQQIVLSDTGPLPGKGGAQEASLLTASVPNLLTAEALHASTVAHGDRSRSEASVADLTLTVNGNTISAGLLRSRATATCEGGTAAVTGSSEIVALVINGQAIVVSEAPNQTVTLPTGGQVIINEQPNMPTGNITVNALHVIVPGVADVVIASSHADITCAGNGCSSDNDFITGGGFVPSAKTRANFGVAGGRKNGSLWGHLVYIDHAKNGVRVKAQDVTAYAITGPTSRHIEYTGTCEVNGTPGQTCIVDVTDNGEPGRADIFTLKVNGAPVPSGTLAGGNIQLHRPCK
ncbi:MAG TPA: choice-of-anchor P family protein [Pyrinomonadaceae bacterium]|nr:choice-of-anchor P family protein [Pyrinomonadaceae bacterium]